MIAIRPAFDGDAVPPSSLSQSGPDVFSKIQRTDSGTLSRPAEGLFTRALPIHSGHLRESAASSSMTKTSGEVRRVSSGGLAATIGSPSTPVNRIECFNLQIPEDDPIFRLDDPSPAPFGIPFDREVIRSIQ